MIWKLVFEDSESIIVELGQDESLEVSMGRDTNNIIPPKMLVNEKFEKIKETKEKKASLWLPFLYEIFGYLAAVSWADHDFPAAEFFDFAADS